MLRNEDVNTPHFIVTLFTIKYFGLKTASKTDMRVHSCFKLDQLCKFV